jgi:hypothetical protein
MPISLRKIEVLDAVIINRVFLSYLFNADSSGLTRSEYQRIRQFDAWKAAEYPRAHYAIAEESEQIDRCELLGTIGDCAEIQIIRVTG